MAVIIATQFNFCFHYGLVDLILGKLSLLPPLEHISNWLSDVFVIKVYPLEAQFITLQEWTPLLLYCRNNHGNLSNTKSPNIWQLGSMSVMSEYSSDKTNDKTLNHCLCFRFSCFKWACYVMGGICHNTLWKYITTEYMVKAWQLYTSTFGKKRLFHDYCRGWTDVTKWLLPLDPGGILNGSRGAYGPNGPHYHPAGVKPFETSRWKPYFVHGWALVVACSNCRWERHTLNITPGPKL